VDEPDYQEMERVIKGLKNYKQLLAELLKIVGTRSCLKSGKLKLSALYDLEIPDQLITIYTSRQILGFAFLIKVKEPFIQIEIAADKVELELNKDKTKFITLE
jgi:hypothetical protein